MQQRPLSGQVVSTRRLLACPGCCLVANWPPAEGGTPNQGVSKNQIWPRGSEARGGVLFLLSHWMLRASHWMPSSKNKALLSFLSARFSGCVFWSVVPLPVQHRPYLHQRCCSVRWLCSSEHDTHVDWQQAEPSSSKFDRPPTLLLANDRKGGHQHQQQQRRRRGLLTAGSARSSLLDPLMAGPVVAPGGAGGVGPRQQEKELVLDREFFSKETTVVAVKLPAKRTR